MSPSQFDRYTKPVGTVRADAKPSSPGAVSEHPALMLDVAYRDGRRVALPYGYLLQAELAEGQELTLKFPEGDWVFRGRNLVALYNQILVHRLYRIRQNADQFDDGADAFVETIEFLERTPTPG